MRSHKGPGRSRHRSSIARANRGVDPRRAHLARTGPLSESAPRGPGRQERPRIALAVLAAGQSSRMEGVHKLLRPYPDRPVIRRSVEVALRAGVDTIAVIVDPASTPVTKAIEDLPVTIVSNPEAARGASTSIARAADWAFERADALILTLADEPELDASVIRVLCDQWRETRAPAMRARYTDRPGHPALITPDFLVGLRLEGDMGLGREIGRSGAELRVEALAPVDLDTEAEYQSALARLTH